MNYFKVVKEKEEIKETMEYIESKRNWNVAKQSYRIPPEEENAIEKSTIITKEMVYWRGQYLIIEHNNMVHYWEHQDGCYLREAAIFIDMDKPAKWKTIEKLISLRMGIRQTEVNCCGYVETILEGEKMTLELYRKFMRFARAQDLQHHGSHTF